MPGMNRSLARVREYQLKIKDSNVNFFFFAV